MDFAAPIGAGHADAHPVSGIAAVTSEKLQIPRSKLQINPKSKSSMGPCSPSLPRDDDVQGRGCLELGASFELGVWNLGFPTAVLALKKIRVREMAGGNPVAS